MQRGDQVVFSGKIEQYLGHPCMNNPAWEFVDQDALKTRTIVPVYPLVAGLTPNVMRRVTESALLAWGDVLICRLHDGALKIVDIKTETIKVLAAYPPPSDKGESWSAPMPVSPTRILVRTPTKLQCLTWE